VTVRLVEHGQSAAYVGRLAGPRYLLWVSEVPASRERPPTEPMFDLDRIIRQELLPAIRARGVRPAVGF